MPKKEALLQNWFVTFLQHFEGRAMSALDTQINGTHYMKCNIQPIEYIHANNMPFIEGNIVKYITRWRDKGGLDDLKKVIHYVELLIELEGKAENVAE